MSPGRRQSIGYTFSTAAMLLFAFLVAVSAPGCVVEPVVGLEATATVRAIRQAQANLALGVGIDMENQAQMALAGVAYGSGLRYDPDNEELIAGLARLRADSTPRALAPTYTPAPTSGPLLPNDGTPDSEFGLRQLGKVVLSALPPRKIVPEPMAVLSTEDQIAIYLDAFKDKEIPPFEMRFFDMKTRKPIFVTRTGEKDKGLARWLNNFVWYKTGSDLPGSYRVEIYSLGKLTHLLPYEVVARPSAALPTPGPNGAAMPSPLPAALQTPVPAAPRVVSVIPADGAQGVPGDTPIRAVLDTTLDPDSVQAGALQLRFGTVGRNGGNGAPPLAGRVTLEPDGKTLSFLPTGGVLPGNGTFTATVSPGLRSPGGASLQQPFNWSFSTTAFGASAGGGISNGDFSLGLGNWNLDMTGVDAGSGDLDMGVMDFEGDSVANLSRRGRGRAASPEDMAGLSQNMVQQVPSGSSMNVTLRILGSGGGALKYILVGARGGIPLTKTGALQQGPTDGWEQKKVDLTSGSDPLQPGDVITRFGVYGTGDDYQYKVDDVKLSEGPAPSATPTPTTTTTATTTATPSPAPPPPTATPPPAPSRDSVQIPALTMVVVTSYSPGLATYLVTADISYSLASSPSGVIRITPYEDESNSGLNFLYEITVRPGTDRITIAAPYIPRATSKKVRFQAYFRDAAGKQVAEGWTDNYLLRK